MALLSLLPSGPLRSLRVQILTTAIPLAVGIVARWVALLVALLAIGYATKFSEHYSRRAMLTWAVLAPALIVAVSGIALPHHLSGRRADSAK